MTRTISLTETLDMRNLPEFIVLFTAFALGFTAVTRVVGVDIATARPLYMFTPAIVGLIVCLPTDIALSFTCLHTGRRRWLALAAILPLSVLGVMTVFSLAIPSVTVNSSFDLAGWIGLQSGPVGTVVAFGVAVIIGATINAIPEFEEEFGWCRYLLWELPLAVLSENGD